MPIIAHILPINKMRQTKILYFRPGNTFTNAVEEEVRRREQERRERRLAEEDNEREYERQCRAEYQKKVDARNAIRNEGKRIRIKHRIEYERIKGIIIGLISAEVVLVLTYIAGAWG